MRSAGSPAYTFRKTVDLLNGVVESCRPRRYTPLKNSFVRTHVVYTYPWLFWSKPLAGRLRTPTSTRVSTKMPRAPPPPPRPPRPPPPPPPPPQRLCSSLESGLRLSEDASLLCFRELDDKLDSAVGAGFPIWISNGNGGHVPGREVHDFAYNRLRDGARVDMQRGTINDDLTNKKWTEWLNHLPKYASKLTQQPRSDIGRGNAMEQAAGIAYAAATEQKFGESVGRLDWTRGGHQQSSQEAWSEVWGAFQKLGLRPTNDTTGAGVMTQASASTRTSASASAATRAKAPEPAPDVPPSAASGRWPPPSATQMGKEKGLTYVRTYVHAYVCY